MGANEELGKISMTASARAREQTGVGWVPWDVWPDLLTSARHAVQGSHSPSSASSSPG